MRPDVSIIIPCYNEAAILETSVAEIHETMRSSRYSYELIFIDDASRDGTPGLIEDICRKSTNCRYILHDNNLGRGGTVCEGIKTARAPIAGFLDIDLEVHARYIPSLVSSLDRGPWAVAIVSRVYRSGLNPNSLLRTALSVGYRKIVGRLFALPFSDTETGFKFFRKNEILPLLDEAKESGWFWDTEIMALAHYRGLLVREVPGLFQRRSDKQSSVKIVRDTLAYLRALSRFRQRLKSL